MNIWPYIKLINESFWATFISFAAILTKKFRTDVEFPPYLWMYRDISNRLKKLKFYGNVGNHILFKMLWVFFCEMKCKGHFKSERDHPQKRGKSDDLSCVVLLLKVTKSPIFQLSYVLLTRLCTFLSLSDRYLVFISFWRKISYDWGNFL